ncbi:hypothetical protein ECC02_010378 [Trypanosoma cruzi]|uniref:Uncharacterized protein n=1 Tax=Trypanosoma cruzi TaxID=5693 RepID=A0A7J6XSI7_TRYCR|nr:hypothetical protein ECC02_010378 [Trypanosoma cruzi]
MLSRVAAVKAPRTHNRRRVTGSSGGRREGRESEPQRPNMSRRVFTSAVLLLLVVMCCGTGGVHAEVQPSQTNFEWKDIPEDATVELLGVPGLLKVGNDVFAVAEAQCKKGEETFTGIASQLLTERRDNTPEKVLNNPKDETKLLEESISEKVKKVDVSRPTTVVKESDIYMLVGIYSSKCAVTGQASAAAQWGLLLVKGKVSVVDSNKRVHWNDIVDIPCISNFQQEKPLAGLIGSGGSGVTMEEDTLVFPVEGTRKLKKEGDTEKDGKTVSLIMYSSDNKNWRLSKGMSADGCGDPSVVEWKDKKLMMMTACDDGRRRVYESGDKGDSWTEALGTLSRVWGNKKERMKRVGSGFITAKIEDRNVMLVTLPVYSSKDGEGSEKEKGKLHLWLTDNTHIVDIGPVSEEDDAAASSLLYKSGKDKEEELIALYEKKAEGEKPSLGMVSVRLTEQLKRVKDVLATWKKVDDIVSKLCATLLALKDPSAENACSADKITDGLVGFLSGSFSGDTWRDEYLGVNATVNKGTELTEATVAAKAEDGVTFHGAWAEWPVGRQGENQLYHFANYNFTLVATVSIDKVPEGDNTIPVMGVHLEGKDKLMELSYDREKKWRVLCSDGKIKKLKSTWETRTQYQVAIVLQKGTHGTAYVDGQRVCGDAQRNLDNTELKGISHFYIGGDGGGAKNKESREAVPVTVKNVFLYNRPLTFSGGNANLEEDADSPSAEGASPSVSGDQKTPPAGKPSEDPVVQATSQQPQQEIKAEQMTTVGKSATTQDVPANTSQGSVEKAAASMSHAVGEATGDAGTMRGSGLLPSLLLLLGLWGFAAL